MWNSLLAVLLVVLVLGCEGDRAEAPNEHEHEHEHEQVPDAGAVSPAAGGYEWNLPAGFPVPPVPEENPMSKEKVELGRHLFYDVRLSDNQTQSCASCHQQSLAFSDGRKTGLGSTGELHPRNAMSLVNVGYSSSLTWANPLFAVNTQDEPLARQSQLPMYGDMPIELGLKSQNVIEERLRGVERYRELFGEAFPAESEPISALNVSRALASFERVLISGRSPYDRFIQEEDEAALSESAKRGYELFFGEKFECFHCHAGFNLSDHVHFEGKALIEVRYHNTGLYNIDGKGAYPEPNTGVFNVTGNPKDMGFFKAPSLRNIALTAPYMHDGSIATLSEVLDHYAAGGRTVKDGPNRGIGKDSPLKDKLVRGFELSEQERADVLAFLDSLTDEAFLNDPALSDPW